MQNTADDALVCVCILAAGKSNRDNDPTVQKEIFIQRNKKRHWRAYFDKFEYKNDKHGLEGMTSGNDCFCKQTIWGGKMTEQISSDFGLECIKERYVTYQKPP